MPNSRGVLLYGPPAAGKDTITSQLVTLGPYSHFQRLKVGPGRTSGYRMGTVEQLATLREHGQVIYENRRYDSTYVVDRSELDAILHEQERVPVLHVGQVDAIRAICRGYPLTWTVVMVFCPREEAAKRLIGRHDARVDERLAVWDETLTEARSADPALFDLVLNTGAFEPTHTAAAIDWCQRHHL
ncbi:kinase [Amycolatopsis sp. NPDC058340]|uniref:kinase n=1 Tax=Amycolatopsis sp. NPDC058340 TaxID=3346453 RepID=UPI003654AA64